MVNFILVKKSLDYVSVYFFPEGSKAKSTLEAALRMDLTFRGPIEDRTQRKMGKKAPGRPKPSFLRI